MYDKWWFLRTGRRNRDSTESPKTRTYGTYNISNDESITINELIKFLKSELDIDNHKITDKTDSLFPNQSFEFDNIKIKNHYDIEFTDLRQGIKKYIEEYNEL